MVTKTKTSIVKTNPSGDADAFGEVLHLIQAAKQRAYQAVNTELVALYWQVGEYISKKMASAEWGDKVVAQLANFLAQTQPNLTGFTRRNLFRMRQFYDYYQGQPIVSALLTQLPWTHHLLIISYSKREEEREFYIRMAIREKWSSRELERQMKSVYFERAILNPVKVSAALRQIHPNAAEFFKDSYSLEFLGLPQDHSEADLHRGLINNLGRFITELGRDFCYIGSEHPLQVGGQDFALDLLFFHRGLNCLVAIELKATRFEPAHLGQLNFYLEALDRDHKKPHEAPAIGLLLCATKDEEVAEYALSRSLSPAMIAQYETLLPSKELLRSKLHEFYQLCAPRDESEEGEAT
jgi:predicted nuclease of restriction endonuclease-like (RecB) superfamily